MFSKLLITVIAMGMATSLFAAEEVKKDEAKKEVVKTWKDKLILSYHGEYGFSREADANTGLATGPIKDYTALHNPSLGYKLTDNLTLSSSWEFKYTDKPKSQAGTFVNRMYRALFSLSRSNILTEKEYGFQMDAGIARRYFDRTAVRGTYGNDRVNVTFTKNFDKNNASLFVQYLANDPKDTSSKETWRRGLELIPTLNLQLTDKLSYTATDDFNINSPWNGGTLNDITMSHEFNFAVFSYKFTDIVSAYLQLKYDHTEAFTNATKTDDFRYYVGASYSVTPKVTVTAEMGSVVLDSADAKSGISDMAKKPEFTLYLDAAF